MKKILLPLILLVFLSAGCEEKRFEVPMLTGRVVDMANLLNSDNKAEIETAILNFEKAAKGQFAVCIVPSIPGETVESASMKVAEKWKIGHKGKDNGILFFLAVNDRQFRIEVGYGFEEKLNDAKAGDIGRKAIPKFKNRRWKDGIVLIINECSNAVSGKKEQAEAAADIPWWQIIIAVVVILIIIVVIVACDSDCGSGGYSGGSGGYSGGSGGFRFGGSGSSSGFSGGGGSFGGGGFSGRF